MPRRTLSRRCLFIFNLPRAANQACTVETHHGIDHQFKIHSVVVLLQRFSVIPAEFAEPINFTFETYCASCSESSVYSRKILTMVLATISSLFSGCLVPAIFCDTS